MQTSVPLIPKFMNDEELSEECKTLISTLPREKGWIGMNMYNYQGFWHYAWQLQGVLACQKNFQAQDSDILLASIPKSGTTWLKAILFSLLNRTRLPHTQEDHPLLSNNPHMLVPSLELQLYLKDENPDLSYIKSPRFLSTHLPYISLPKSIHDSKCKVVYVCRNPKDTFISLWDFTNKMNRLRETRTNSLEEVFEKFCEGASWYGPFWDHMLGYWEESLKNSDKIYFLTYEGMKEQPELHLRKLANFLGCPFSLEEEKQSAVEGILKMCSFDNLSNLKVNKEGKFPNGRMNSDFFRKGEVGDWKNYLTLEMVERLEKVCEEKLEGLGLKF